VAGSYITNTTPKPDHLLDDESLAFRQVQRRTHPVRHLLDNCAHGYQPVQRDIDDIVGMAYPEDRASVRAKLNDVIAEARRLYIGGSHQRAAMLARESAFELGKVVGPYRPPREDLRGLGPRELAARIRRT
jgi:hypothetical protein